MRIRNVAILIVLLAILVIYTYSANAEAIQTLNLPTSLEIIGEQAFYQDTSLNKVVVPEGATSIESMAFAYSSLQEISLPRTITSIADDAFEGCGQFEIEVPMNCYAYTWCLNHGYIGKPDPTPAECFTYETINGLFASITGYTGSDTVVVIPEEIDDYIIHRISDNAFENNETIEYVFLPDSVTEIGDSAFCGCTALFGVDVGNRVEMIGSYAFYGCTSLIGIDFPDTLKTTGRCLFENCINLEYFDYPINWEEAGSHTIAGCNKIEVLAIPEGATLIPSLAFANCDNLTGVMFSSTVTEIEIDAFCECNGLTEITIPGNIQKLNGFRNCNNLSIVLLHQGLISIGNSSFENCISLESIELPTDLKIVGDSAFYGCTMLTSCSFSNGLESVGRYAFQECCSLQEAILPDSVVTIGTEAFKNCSKMRSFHYPISWNHVAEKWGGYNPECEGYIFDGCKSLKDIIVPEGVETIPACALQGSSYLRTIILPSTLKQIGNFAFSSCESIASLDFPVQLNHIGQSAFENCTYLHAAELPDSVETIGTSAFKGCAQLSSFHYPLNWTTVANRYGGYNPELEGFIFEGCTSLESIVIPEGVTSIPDFAFQGSKDIKSIVFPSTLQTIGNSALASCEGITNLTFPAQLNYIGWSAFENCLNLNAAELPDSVEMIGTGAFRGCENISSFHYPVNWTFMANKYGGYNPELEGFVFEGCESLKSIIVPDGVNTIPDCAFQGSDFIERIYVPTFVSSIGERSFNACPVLTIWTEYGAYALQYAKDNNIPYYYLTPDGVNSPSGTLYKGDSYALYGYARSSVSITEVTASILNSSGSVVQTITVNPGMTDYSLSGRVNASLLFGTLQLGSYRYTLMARTDVSEEVWADNTFTIVPPPLRIYISGLSMPSGLIQTGISALGGTIISNYIITSVQIDVYDSANSSVIRTFTSNPGTYQYDLSDANASLSLSTIGNGAYSIRITAISNGETRVLTEGSYQCAEYSGVLDDDTVQRLIAFAADESNRDLFTTQYAQAVVDGQDWVEHGIVLFDNYLNTTIFDLIENRLIYGGQRQDLIELYKKEIIGMIDTGAYDVVGFASNTDRRYGAILSYLKARTKFDPDAFESEEAKEFIECLNDLLSDIKMVVKLGKNLETAYETLASISAHLEEGLLILDSIEESIGAASKDEFRTALYLVKNEYISYENAELQEAGKIIMDALLEEGEDAIKDIIERTITKGKFTLGNNLPRIVGKLLYWATGLDETAKNYKTFFVQYDMLMVSLDSYYSAFDAVKNGDYSTQAMNRFSISIYTTKSIYLRLHETIGKLPIYLDISNAALDYIYGPIFRNVDFPLPLNGSGGGGSW